MTSNLDDAGPAIPPAVDGATRPPARRRFQYSLRTLLIVVAVFAALFGSGVWAVQKARERERKRLVMEDFRVVPLALENYYKAHHRWAPAVCRDQDGKPLCSWRFLLFPYVEESCHYYDPRSEPWNAPRNRDIVGIPGDSIAFTLHLPDASRQARIVAITGPGTAFEEGVRRKVEELPPDLIVLVETRNSGVHWMEPGDLDVRTMPRTIDAADGKGISANFGDRVHVAFADGTVWALSTDVPFATVEKFLTIDSAKRHDRDVLLGPYQRP